MLSVRQYFLVAVLLLALAPQNTCAKCPKGCDYCDSSDVPVGQCSDCSFGYGLTPQKTCAKCPKNCDYCDSSDVPVGQCSDCGQGHGLTPQKTCAKCVKGCYNCDSTDVPAGQCSSCDIGYGLTPQKTCAECPKGCWECDSSDVPAGKCSDCDYGYDLTPQKTCAKDCSRFDCCTYDCPKAKAGTCSEESGNFSETEPIRTISWKTTAKRLTVETCQAACLKDPSCFAYRFYGWQNCKGSRPCTRCPCKNFGQHEGSCDLYGADAKNEIQAQSFGTAYTFITRIGGYCWH